MQCIVSNDFRDNLKQLVPYLTNHTDLQWIFDFIDKFEFDQDELNNDYTHSYSQEDIIAAQEVSMLYEILQPEFMLFLDWKEEVEELKLGIEELVRDNFGISHITLPKVYDHGDRSSLSNPDVFHDFQRELRKQGFSLANILTGDDAFLIIVFPTTNINQIKPIFDKLKMALEFI